MLGFTGTMPMSGTWADVLGTSSITLPDDWPTLARALAADDNPADARPWATWDTSGKSTGFEGHVTGTPPCSASPFTGAAIEPTGPDSYTSVLDNGDDCTGGGLTTIRPHAGRPVGRRHDDRSVRPAVSRRHVWSRSANATSRIVVAHAQNIDGSPFAGEIVCFSSDGEGMTWFNGTVGGIDLSRDQPRLRSQGREPRPRLRHHRRQRQRRGRGAGEQSGVGERDRRLRRRGQGILRTITVDYAPPGTSGGTPAAGHQPVRPAGHRSGGERLPGGRVLRDHPAEHLRRGLGCAEAEPGEHPAVTTAKAQITLIRTVRIACRRRCRGWDGRP